MKSEPPFFHFLWNDSIVGHWLQHPHCAKLLSVHYVIQALLCFLCLNSSVCVYLFLFQRNASLPDENNVVRLQEELIGVKLREAEALTGLKELRQQVRDLEEHWQVNAHTQKQLFYQQLENVYVCVCVCVSHKSLSKVF